MEKYKAYIGINDTSIYKYYVIKETKHRITYEIERISWRSGKLETETICENIVGSNHSWFDTFEDAKLYCIDEYNKKIKMLLRRVELYTNEITYVNNFQIDDNIQTWTTHNDKRKAPVIIVEKEKSNTKIVTTDRPNVYPAPQLNKQCEK